ETLYPNLPYAIRLMRNRPGFSAVVVLTLGLGIGANTAVFTVVDAALIRALPYRDPDRLAHLWENKLQQQTMQREASYPDFVDLREQAEFFEQIAGYNGRNVTLTNRDVKERLQSVRVTANFFSLLGIEPLLGRTFEQDDDRPGAPALVILNHGLWQRRFGGDPGVVGQRLDLNGTQYTVIGI